MYVNAARRATRDREAARDARERRAPPRPSPGSPARRADRRTACDAEKYGSVYTDRSSTTP